MFKPLRMTDTIVVVSIADPAIDWEAAADKELVEAVAKWEAEKAPDGAKPERKTKEQMMDLESGRAIRDPLATSRLPVKAGEQVCKFTLGVVPSDEIVRIESEDRDFNKQRWRWFVSSLVDVTGFGKPNKRKIGDVEYVDPEWTRKTFVRGYVEIGKEIGWYARMFNKVTEDEIRG